MSSVGQLLPPQRPPFFPIESKVYPNLCPLLLSLSMEADAVESPLSLSLRAAVGKDCLPVVTSLWPRLTFLCGIKCWGWVEKVLLQVERVETY